jgi:hypothetical protein
VVIVERRHCPRIDLSLPTVVEGHSAGEPWKELVRSIDASLGGASLPLEHEVRWGQVLRLSLPLPKGLRCYDLGDPSYEVYAVVRHVVGGTMPRRVGTVFLGRNPPAGYAEDPESLFLLPSDPAPAGRDRRRFRRLVPLIGFRVRQGDGPWDPTVAENLSRQGARIMSALSVSSGQWLDFEELEGGFRTRAEVGSSYVGSDGIPRIDLRFETPAPERLVDSPSADQ